MSSDDKEGRARQVNEISKQASHQCQNYNTMPSQKNVHCFLGDDNQVCNNYSTHFNKSQNALYQTQGLDKKTIDKRPLIIYFDMEAHARSHPIGSK